MTRPHIVRADSIDLQDHEAPSAKDHRGHHPNLANGSVAPHQAETLREVAQETAEANTRSPHLSWQPGEGPAADLKVYADDLAAGVNSALAGGATQNGNGSAATTSVGTDARTMQSQAQTTQHQQQRDALAIAQNGGVSGQTADDGGLDGDSDDDMDDDMMDKISSSPSIEDEDIDFEFVYALHTFVATVEGQANATKGDTMVLLDDSNSYWWLVRVVKDSSIGYLPAEHIETPTERLARLNKHRNIDLSAAMLGDQAEKSKGTFKAAIRGRRKKTVTFTAPTYVDYSDIDYSSEEEDIDEIFAQQQAIAAQQQAAQQATNEELEDDTAKVEPLKPRTQKDAKADAAKRDDATRDDDSRQSSDETYEKPSVSRNGTVRNTDSFFKDESVETKKITLTPNLLRDDNTRTSSEAAAGGKDGGSGVLRQRPSLDKLDKDGGLLAAKDKDDKKKKDKKPSAIRSFFSRKDKKKNAGDDDDDSYGKRSMDNEGQERDSEDPAADEAAAASAAAEKASPSASAGAANGAGVQRNPSKLQKQQPRTEPSPTRKPGSGPPQKSPVMELAAYIASEGRTNDVSHVPPASMRIVQPDSAVASPSLENGTNVRPRDRSPEVVRTNGLGISGQQQQQQDVRGVNSAAQKPVGRSRMDFDDEFDSDEEDMVAPSAAEQQRSQTQTKPVRPVIPGAFPDSYMTTASSAPSDRTATPGTSQVQAQQQSQSQSQPQSHQTERLSESPVQVSPVTSSNPPALVGDTSSQEGRSTASPSPELVEVHRPSQRGIRSAGQATGQGLNQGQRGVPERSGSDASVLSASDHASGSEPRSQGSAAGTWDDGKLRAFFDEGDEVRDLLLVVHDTTDVVPAGPDHPLVGGLFREQNAKLAEITTQLDNMLGDWLARKQRSRGSL